MGFLRRLIGGSAPEVDDDVTTDLDVRPDPGDLDDQERVRDLELLRGEHERLDELQQRQLRYAWQPPAEGGERRAEDGDKPAGT
jgi:hypothetical protein